MYQARIVTNYAFLLKTKTGKLLESFQIATPRLKSTPSLLINLPVKVKMPLKTSGKLWTAADGGGTFPAKNSGPENVPIE